MLVLVTAQNVATITPTNIAFMSCEDSAYGDGVMSASALFDTVLSRDPAGIVLYSTLSNHCNYTLNGGISSEGAMVYSMISRNDSLRFEDTVKAVMPLFGPALIAESFTTNRQIPGNGTGGEGGGNNNQNVLGPSPTTAVAMIILYSITGVITGLFLIIIITGAIRAHRHPERYGPRHGAGGRPRQSRAKGIARAMLETIPIVKFGDDHEGSKPTATDMELGGGDATAKPTNTATDKAPETVADEAGPRSDAANREAVPSDPNKQDETVEPAKEMTETDKGKTRVTSDGDITSVAAAGAAAPAESKDEVPKQEDGLGCSICTEDFVKGEDVRVLPCNHKYHPECVDPWLLNVSGTCPLW